MVVVVVWCQTEGENMALQTDKDHDDDDDPVIHCSGGTCVLLKDSSFI